MKHRTIFRRRICGLLLAALFLAAPALPAAGTFAEEAPPLETASEKTAEAENDKVSSMDEEVVEGVPIEDGKQEPAFLEYLQTYADPEKTGVCETLTPYDVIMVKHTIVRKDRMPEGDLTIDGLFRDDDQDGLFDYADAFEMQAQSYMLLYEADPEADFVVGFTDTQQSPTSEVTDVIIAQNNNEGIVLDDCLYDWDTGLVYIPKSYREEREDKTLIGATQIQMLYVQTEDVAEEAVSGIRVSIDCKRIRGDVVKEGVASAPLCDDRVALQIANDATARGSVTEQSIRSVSVNGVETEHYDYDPETGVLNLYTQSPSTTSDVEIRLENKPALARAFEAAASALFPTVYAAPVGHNGHTAAQEYYKNGKVTLKVSSLDDLKGAQYLFPKGKTEITYNRYLDTPNGAGSGADYMYKSGAYAGLYHHGGGNDNGDLIKAIVNNTKLPSVTLAYDDFYDTGTGTLYGAGYSGWWWDAYVYKGTYQYQNGSRTIAVTYPENTHMALYCSHIGVKLNYEIGGSGTEKKQAYNWVDPSAAATGKGSLLQKSSVQASGGVTPEFVKDRSVTVNGQKITMHYYTIPIFSRVMKVEKNSVWVGFVTGTGNTQAGGVLIKYKAEEARTNLKIRKQTVDEEGRIQNGTDLAGALYVVKDQSDKTAGFFLTGADGTGYVAAKTSGTKGEETVKKRFYKGNTFTRTSVRSLELGANTKYKLKELLAPLNKKYAKNTTEKEFTTGKNGSVLTLTAETSGFRNVLGEQQIVRLKLTKTPQSGIPGTYNTAGAVYGVYTSKTGSKLAKTTDGYEAYFMVRGADNKGYVARRIGDNGTTASDEKYRIQATGSSTWYGSNFKSTVLKLFAGTYYVREIIGPRTGRYLLDGPQKVVLEGGDTKTVKSKEQKATGRIYLQKSSPDGGNLKNAVYQVFHWPEGTPVLIDSAYPDDDPNETNTYVLGLITNAGGKGYAASNSPGFSGTLSTAAEGIGTIRSYGDGVDFVYVPDTLGDGQYNYVVKEIKSPAGFALDSAEYKVKATATNPGSVNWNWNGKTGSSGDFSAKVSSFDLPEDTVAMSLTKMIEGKEADSSAFEFEVALVFPEIAEDSTFSATEHTYGFSGTFEGAIDTGGSRDYELNLSHLAVKGHPYTIAYDWQAYWNDGSTTEPHNREAGNGHVGQNYSSEDSSDTALLNPGASFQAVQQHLWQTGAQTDHTWKHWYSYTDSEGKSHSDWYWDGGYGHMHTCTVCGASYDDYNQSAPSDSTCTRYTTVRYEIRNLKITIDPEFPVVTRNGATYTKSDIAHYTVRLAREQQWIISGLPTGTQYTITERNPGAYKLEYAIDGGDRQAVNPISGTLTEDLPQVTAITAYNSQSPVPLKLIKTALSSECAAQFTGPEYTAAHAGDVDKEGNPDPAEYNRMYTPDFSGAEFLVQIDRPGETVADQTYVTAEDGTIEIKTLYAGDTVTLTETGAPNGYHLPDAPVIRFRVNENNTVTLLEASDAAELWSESGTIQAVYRDQPLLAPDGITIRKAISRLIDGAWAIVEGTAINGAVFRWDYYDNSNEDHTNDQPVRTWYFVSARDPAADQDGVSRYDPDFLLDADAVSELARTEADFTKLSEYVAVNDANPLFWMPEGEAKRAALPLGSVEVTEVWSPPGYQLYEGMLSAAITQDTENPETILYQWAEPDGREMEIDEDHKTATMADREITMAVSKSDAMTGQALDGAWFRITDITDGLRFTTKTFSGEQLEQVVLPETTLYLASATAYLPGEEDGVRCEMTAPSADPDTVAEFSLTNGRSLFSLFAVTGADEATGAPLSPERLELTYAQLSDVETAKAAAAEHVDFRTENGLYLSKQFLTRDHAYLLEETDFPDGYVLSEDDIFFHVTDEGAVIPDISTWYDEEGRLQSSLPETDVVRLDGQDQILPEEAEGGYDCLRFLLRNTPNQLTVTKTDAGTREAPDRIVAEMDDGEDTVFLRTPKNATHIQGVVMRTGHEENAQEYACSLRRPEGAEGADFKEFHVIVEDNVYAFYTNAEGLHAWESGPHCYLTVTYTASEHPEGAMANVRFQVSVEDLPEDAWIGELADGTVLYNDHTFVTDADGLYTFCRLRRGHTYSIQEIETFQGKTLLAEAVTVDVAQETGRIIGPNNTWHRHGNIAYILNLRNHDGISLFTGGRGTWRFYLTGLGIAGGVLTLVLIRRKTRQQNKTL